MKLLDNIMVCDIECYPNYFLIAFESEGKVLTVDTTDTFTKAQKELVLSTLKSNTIVTFNGMKYDLPMITYSLYDGIGVKELHKMSTRIIEKNLSQWATYSAMGVRELKIDHIDLIEPSPAVNVGLKLYGTRLGTKKLQDLPFDPMVKLSKKERKELKDYCENDLTVTHELFDAIRARIELRVKLSEKYGMNLNSKSDAQLAEAVIVKALGYQGKAPKLDADYQVKYKCPKHIKFKTPLLKQLKKIMVETPFKLDGTGKPAIPKELSSYKIQIGNTAYKIGIGGLHSQEKSLWVKGRMKNADIASMYPSLILNQGLYPKHLGKKFLKEYRNFYETRLASKPLAKSLPAGDEKDYHTLITDSFKVVLNGLYGKFGSKYSKVFSPDLLLQTTLTGQLELLMVIERLELKGIPVMSANTDGVEAYCPTKKMEKKFEKIVSKQGEKSNLVYEFGTYDGLFARDVNNYVANYGSYVKAKGVYADPTSPENFLRKNTQTPICFEAVREFILNDVPISKTIKKCKDIKLFLTGRTVSGGGTWGTPIFGEPVEVTGSTGKVRKVNVVDGWEKGSQYLGKVVRWYYSVNGKSIHQNKNGALVPLSEGAMPMMDLTKKIPKDLDYQWYIDYANRMLEDLGYVKA